MLYSNNIKSISDRIEKVGRIILLEQLLSFIKSGKYDDATKICSMYTLNQLKDFLLKAAYDTSDFSLYSFAQYMFIETDKIEWLKTALSLVIGPFCFVDGAYSIGLFHARQLLARDYSIQNLEQLLFFHDIPEKLINRDEALEIADRILKFDSSNQLALKII